MQTPTNPFKKAIAAKRSQIGLWVSLLGPLNTEICAAAGFEHHGFFSAAHAEEIQASPGSYLDLLVWHEEVRCVPTGQFASRGGSRGEGCQDGQDN